jgi:site-specific recombinase XerD
MRHPNTLGKQEVEPFLTDLAVSLFYGSGLRLMECLRLRVGDADFEQRNIRVFAGKGDKDRMTVFPDRLEAALLPWPQTYPSGRGALGAISPLDK